MSNLPKILTSKFFLNNYYVPRKNQNRSLPPTCLLLKEEKTTWQAPAKRPVPGTRGAEKEPLSGCCTLTSNHVFLQTLSSRVCVCVYGGGWVGGRIGIVFTWQQSAKHSRTDMLKTYTSTKCTSHNLQTQVSQASWVLVPRWIMQAFIRGQTVCQAFPKGWLIDIILMVSLPDLQ